MSKDETMKDYIQLEIEKMRNEAKRVESQISTLEFQINGARLVIQELGMNIAGHEEQLAAMDKKLVTPKFPSGKK